MGDTLFSAILSGGTGKRFWPAGRRARPKPFLRLLPGGSLLRTTWERILTLCPADRILVVAHADHESLVRADLPELPAANLLLEPAGRNTAAAIAVAALEARRRSSRSVLLAAPADHHIGDPAAFRTAVRAAVRLCGTHLVTFGIRPTRPETGFGYIRAGTKLSGGRGREVVRFIEKPTRPAAEALLREEGIYWNSGILLVSPERILAAVEAHLPGLGGVLGELDGALARGDAPLPGSAYAGLDDVSIDHGVLEKSGDMAVVPLDCDWSDLGDWSSFGARLGEGEGGNRGLGEIVAIDSEGNVVVNPGGLTGLIGVGDLVVVRSGNEVLVCSRDRCQDVKLLVESLEKSGGKERL